MVMIGRLSKIYSVVVILSFQFRRIINAALDVVGSYRRKACIPNDQKTVNTGHRLLSDIYTSTVNVCVVDTSGWLYYKWITIQ